MADLSQIIRLNSEHLSIMSQNWIDEMLNRVKDGPFDPLEEIPIFGGKCVDTWIFQTSYSLENQEGVPQDLVVLMEFVQSKEATHVELTPRTDDFEPELCVFPGLVWPTAYDAGKELPNLMTAEYNGEAFVTFATLNDPDGEPAGLVSEIVSGPLRRTKTTHKDLKEAIEYVETIVTDMHLQVWRDYTTDGLEEDAA